MKITRPVPLKLSPLILATLLLASGGGLIFYWLALPLPWMLGSLVFCLVASLAKVPLQAPNALRTSMSMIIGMFLGCAFSPGLLEQARQWWPSLLMLLPYCALLALIGVPLLRGLGKHSMATSYFSAMPGGLQEMAIIGKAAGADERAVVLFHSLRILLVVMTIPWLMHFSEPVRSHADEVVLAQGFAWLWLIPLAAMGGWGAKAIHMPAPWLFGPLLVSAGLHLTGLSSAQLPWLLVACAQVVIGCCLGCRFQGSHWRALLPWVGQSLLLVLLMLLTCALFAWLCFHWFGLPGVQVFLAFAPGGLAESGLIGHALGLDVAYISAHHLLRIMLVMLIAPLVFRWFQHSQIRASELEDD